MTFGNDPRTVSIFGQQLPNEDYSDLHMTAPQPKSISRIIPELSRRTGMNSAEVVVEANDPNELEHSSTKQAVLLYASQNFGMVKVGISGIDSVIVVDENGNLVPLHAMIHRVGEPAPRFRYRVKFSLQSSLI